MNDIMEIESRITAYLSGGGLFNPELANHDAVRDLLMDCRIKLAEQAEYLRQANNEVADLRGYAVMVNRRVDMAISTLREGK